MLIFEAASGFLASLKIEELVGEEFFDVRWVCERRAYMGVEAITSNI